MHVLSLSKPPLGIHCIIYYCYKCITKGDYYYYLGVIIFFSCCFVCLLVLFCCWFPLRAAYVSYGGLLMRLQGDANNLQGFEVDMNVYLLMKKIAF